MKKGILIATLLATSTFAVSVEELGHRHEHNFPNYERAEFYRGEGAQKVTISYENDETPRAYESKCNVNLGLQKEEEGAGMRVLHTNINCREGMDNDRPVAYKYEEGQVFMTNRYGQIDRKRGAVGTISDSEFSVSFNGSRTQKFAQPVMDENGCPTRELELVEREISYVKSIKLTTTEEGYDLERNVSESKVVPMMKHFPKCDITHARLHFSSSRTRTFKGSMTK